MKVGDNESAGGGRIDPEKVQPWVNHSFSDSVLRGPHRAVSYHAPVRIVRYDQTRN